MWPSQPVNWPQRRLLVVRTTTIPASRPNARVLFWFGCLACVLVAQGFAVTQSYIWAVPLLCLLVVAIAIDLPLVPVVGLSLLVRALTDDLSAANSRHSASVNLSAAIAGVYILIALGLLLWRRRAAWPAALAMFWLCLWTAIAVHTNGASIVTVREGVRELSIIALVVIVLNSRGALNVSLVTRMIQLVGVISAAVALYQLVTHGGQLVGGEMRANGTFAQPNSAAAFFAVVTMVSVWRYVNNGHRRSDAVFAVIYATATVSTFSLGGLACLLTMLIAFGLLRPGSTRIKLGSCAVAALIVVAFLATPLGAERIAIESSNTRVTATGNTEQTSLTWRFYKWGTLIPEWESSPFIGQGLGTTITSKGTENDRSLGLAPHSEPVRYLVETGIIGLFTLIAAVIFLLRRLMLQRRIAGNRETATLGLAVVLGMMVNSLAANTIIYTPASYAAALIVAAVLASPSTVGQVKGIRRP
jgi:O-antigen ligase